jgi:hypothetical protein
VIIKITIRLRTIPHLIKQNSISTEIEMINIPKSKFVIRKSSIERFILKSKENIERSNELCLNHRVKTYQILQNQTVQEENSRQKE